MAYLIRVVVAQFGQAGFEDLRRREPVQRDVRTIPRRRFAVAKPIPPSDPVIRADSSASVMSFPPMGVARKVLTQGISVAKTAAGGVP
jgi:hypothetical protein